MQSESARMSSAAEARYRIDAPNSKPRSVKVIALDTPSERVIKEYGADKGLVQTLSRLAEYLSKMG